MLSFGFRDAVPADAPAAWGARAIVHGVSLDVPHDRVSFAGDAGPKAALIDKLKAIDPIKLAEKALSDSAIAVLVDGGDKVLDIYEDIEVKIAGRLAGGYLYLAAYLKPAPPGIVLPRKATGDIGSAAGGPVWLKLIRKVLDSPDKSVFKLLDVGPGEDGIYRESYEGADIVFPPYDESVVLVVPKSPAAEAIIIKSLDSLKEEAA